MRIRILFICLITFSTWAGAQETVQFSISRKEIISAYFGMFERNKLFLYNDIRSGLIKAYSDDEMTKVIKSDQLALLGTSLVPVKRQKMVDNQWITYDTAISRPFDGNGLNGFKWVKGGAGFKLFFKTFPDTSKLAGHPFAVISWNEAATYFSKTELALLKEFQQNIKTPGANDFVNKENVANYYLARIGKFKGDLYTKAMNGDIAMFEKSNFKRILPPVAALRLYGMDEYRQFFRVPGDSSTLYDSLVSMPFPGDTIDGFTVIIGLGFDPVSGVTTETFKGIAPGIDPSGGGAVFVPIDPMFWIKWEEAQKMLTPDQMQLIYEMVYMQKIDKLNRPCD